MFQVDDNDSDAEIEFEETPYDVRSRCKYLSTEVFCNFWII